MRTTVGTDWLARVTGGDSSVGATGTTTSAPTATTVTDTGQAWTVNQWKGHPVFMGSVYGIAISNSASVITLDRWYIPSTPGGAAGTTPGTGVYTIGPGNGPMWWMALSTDVTAPAVTDSPLPSEVSTNGLGRAVATFAHTNGTSTYTLTKTFTASGGSTTIAKIGLNYAQNGGDNIYSTAEQAPNPALGPGDTLNQTETLTLS